MNDDQTGRRAVPLPARAGLLGCGGVVVSSPRPYCHAGRFFAPAGVASFFDWLGSIAGKVKGLFGSSGAPSQFKKDLDDANKNYVPMRFDPGTSQTKATPIALSLNVDGRTLAQSISEQLEQLYEHATGAPSYNGQSHFNRADGGMMGT
jgi:hypothetical protein